MHGEGPHLRLPLPELLDLPAVAAEDVGVIQHRVQRSLTQHSLQSGRTHTCRQQRGLSVVYRIHVTVLGSVRVLVWSGKEWRAGLCSSISALVTHEARDKTH